MQGFEFDREAIGKLVLSLWKFVNEDHGVIARSDPGGDIGLTVDFSHVIPSTDLNIEPKQLQPWLGINSNVRQR